ncbi:MAG TPA: tRNA (adenosine(37)-N6)-dimethylallyltransferase MiaA [Polyangiaceae bacterium]|nr:tRNA (adenosine(37)-N6)-dimethylallyltransferase MiaA [Polyangiaceae bacterium]
MGAGSAPLLVIVGPTASGKTELAVQVAEASNGEIVSADSVQVYRGFDIGSGKPSAEQRRRAPHHLIDVCDPLDAMDAARWAALAEASISDIVSRGRRPIVCGGTYLWVRALIFGLAAAPPGDPTLRAQHRALVDAEGRAALHARLAAADPQAAARLSPNDFVRVSRALEVLELSGKPIGQWQQSHGFREPRYPVRQVGVALSRDELDRRIDRRVADMLAAGWLQEVERLIAGGHADARAMSSVGYRQVAAAVLAGQTSPSPELHQEIYRKTRVFARRQRTWLRDQPVEWLPLDQAKALVM